MRSSNENLTIIMSRDLASMTPGIQEDFEREGIHAILTPAYVVKAAGPIPANFIVDIAHLGTQVLDNLLTHLENALAVALIAVFVRLRHRLAPRVVRIQVSLPGENRRVSYILPHPPEDEVALKAIKRHYASLPIDVEGELYWRRGRWVSTSDLMA
jgi:hypothetical protein